MKHYESIYGCAFALRNERSHSVSGPEAGGVACDGIGMEEKQTKKVSQYFRLLRFYTARPRQDRSFKLVMSNRPWEDAGAGNLPYRGVRRWTPENVCVMAHVYRVSVMASGEKCTQGHSSPFSGARKQ